MTGTSGSTLRTSIRCNNDTPVARFVELAVAAEEAGFDQIWVSHDILLRSAPVLLAAAATATSRIQLGVGILNPYSAHPVELAMHAATLQELSGGRALLGIGAGAAEFLQLAGVERSRPLARTREAVLACRALLAGREPAGEPGTGTWAPSARLPDDMTAGRPPVPVYVGAMSPRMLAMAGALADGVLALLYPPEHFPVAAAQVLAGATAAGRDPASVDLPACVWVSVDRDPDRAAAALAEKLAFYGPAFAPYLLERAGLTAADFAPAAAALATGHVREAVGLVTPAMLRLGIAGAPTEVVARGRSLLMAGASHLSFGPPLGPDPVEAVRLLGREVISPLRSVPEG